MGAAFGWGLLAGSSLVIGSVVALLFRIPLRLIGLIMGFGAGVLISAVAFDLVEEAAEKSSGSGWVAAGLFAGCLVFYGGDKLIDRLGGGDRKAATGEQESGSPLSIVLGTVLDGIPESMVIGLTIYQGGAVGAAYLAAVFISNLPESIAASSELKAQHSARWILSLWGGIALASAVAAGLGFEILGGASDDAVAFVKAFAGGAILCMLADTMVPQALKKSGDRVGLVTVLGFALAALLSTA
jgi:zinc transporter, ZIP family